MDAKVVDLTIEHTRHRSWRSGGCEGSVTGVTAVIDEWKGVRHAVG